MGVLKVYFKEYKWDALDQRVELQLLPRRKKVKQMKAMLKLMLLLNNLPETPLLEKLLLLQKLPLLQRLPLLQMPLQQVVMLVVTVAPEATVVTVTEAAELGGNFASANASQ